MKQTNTKNNPPKVSVIIPVYNTEKYLQQAIESICQQTLYELEIIIIDDGSQTKVPAYFTNWLSRIIGYEYTGKIIKGYP